MKAHAGSGFTGTTVGKALAVFVCCLALQACSDDSAGDATAAGSLAGNSSGNAPGTTQATAPVEPADLTPVACMAPQADIQARALELVNLARSTERQCGDRLYPAASPLEWDTLLEDAAREHSEDMARNNYFSHTGSDGSSVSNRVNATGFRWRTVGENIGRGQRSVADVVNGWLESPGHCRNIMTARLTLMAVTCVEDSNSYLERYWTQVLALPR